MIRVFRVDSRPIFFYLLLSAFIRGLVFRLMADC